MKKKTEITKELTPMEGNHDFNYLCNHNHPQDEVESINSLKHMHKGLSLEDIHIYRQFLQWIVLSCQLTLIKVLFYLDL